MRQLTVHKNDENQRLDKYLKKYLNNRCVNDCIEIPQVF